MESTGSEAESARHLKLIAFLPDTEDTCGCVARLAWRAGIDFPLAHPYVPRLARNGHENRKLTEDIEKARQELPRRTPQGPGLRHQQDKPALQGAPGLSRNAYTGSGRRWRCPRLTRRSSRAATRSRRRCAGSSPVRG